MSRAEAELLFVEAFGFRPDDLDWLVEEVARGAQQEWQRLARSRLFTTANDYANGIEIVRVAPAHYAVVLTPQLANLQEQGAPPWDLRLTVLASPKAKVSKDGHRHVSIPFRHQTPGTDGSYGRPMPADVYGQAKKLRDTPSGADAIAAVQKLAAVDPDAAAYYHGRLQRSTRGTIWGGIAELQPKRQGGQLPEGLAPKVKPYHATDAYAGVYRMGKSYSAGTQAQYLSFRTISDNPETKRRADGQVAGEGDAVANWIHPGFTPLHLAGEVETYIHTQAIDLAFSGARARASGA